MTLTGWRHRLLVLAPFIGVAALIVASPSDDGPTVCPFALCTGMACPGCGMTRAASQLIRGDFGAAIGYHPLVPIIGLQLLGGWVWYLLRRSGRVKPLSNRTLNIVLIGTAVALVSVWALRMALDSLPAV
ncbi:MAG: DUF2752 domain-containing protein [Acidimicrobiia bacterium]